MPFKNQHPLYSVWQGMLRRCYTPTTRQFHDYGGRGIAVCERWRGADGFKNFVSDMGVRPEGCTLDRYPNNDGNYEPGNCRWATRKQQQYNLRTNNIVVIEGREYIAAALANAFRLKPDTVVNRARLGLTLAEVTSPAKRVFAAGLALGGKASADKRRAITHCPQGHAYDENAAYTPKGWRYCMECKRIKQKARYARQKAGDQPAA